MNRLQLYLLPGKGASKEFKDVYNKTYKLWHDVWHTTMKEEWQDHTKILHSDDFTRQDEVLALFDGSDCVGCVFFKEVDFSEVSHAEDSYFKVWNEMALKKLRSKGEKILVCSNFTVAKKYRQNFNDISWKGLLMSLLVLRFEHSFFHAMTGTMRRSKGMHTVTYDYGAVPIAKNLDYYICGINEPVDLVGFFQEEVAQVQHPELANEIWGNVMALSLPIIESEEELLAA